ncbi:uncharacterized protein TM35_000072180 [Trypanosoma theileri]|uniref:Uncharacterized protein n=1 Tax=Trypanosoma theileri TaxID=67003 RepID=A0A1X0P1G7_9TRYP|nr:uncharacterized protein TM35_000072180 [Trypanosoma theileri]ORC90794.1 hypothetical protein TM35_000072180 [Trypanosoma theileri]
MVLPPRHVYSARVKNTTSKLVKLHATYAMPNNMEDVEVSVLIQPGESAVLQQKVVQVEHMELTAHIRCIAVDGAKLEAPFDGVNSPVKDYSVEIRSDGNILQLHGHP